MSAPSLTGLGIRTARVSYSGSGRIDITFRGNHPIGSAFAPTGVILGPVLKTRERVKQMLERAAHAASHLRAAGRVDLAALVLRCAAEEAEELQRAAWEIYAPLYLAGLERSTGNRSDAWGWLAERARSGDQIVGVCFCAGPETEAPRLRCHRFLWAARLVELGAVYAGEVLDAAARRRAAGAR